MSTILTHKSAHAFIAVYADAIEFSHGNILYTIDLLSRIYGTPIVFRMQTKYIYRKIMVAIDAICRLLMVSSRGLVLGAHMGVRSLPKPFSLISTFTRSPMHLRGQ